MPGLSALFSGLTDILLLVVMLVGLFGMVIPIFPGGVVIWLAALAYGLLHGFSGFGWLFFILITALMIACLFVDDFFMAAEARKSGASWWSLFFAFCGGILGTLFFPPFGGLIGSPLVLFAFEYMHRRDLKGAWAVTRGMLVGWGWSFVARFGMGLVMITMWAGWVWTHPA